MNSIHRYRDYKNGYYKCDRCGRCVEIDNNGSIGKIIDEGDGTCIDQTNVGVYEDNLIWIRAIDEIMDDQQ